MKYSSYIDNVSSLEWGLTIQQAYVFAWLWDVPSWAETAIFDGDVWYFASKTKVLEELPLLTNKLDTVYRHYKALKNKSLIEVKKVDGKDYIKFTEKSKNWGRKSDYSEINPSTLGNKSEYNSEINPTYNTTILNNTTKDKTTTKERKKKKESFDFKSVQGLNYEYWQTWKDFKKEQFNFTFKEIGEKTAITELLNISNGNTSKQKDIIIQSIKNGYKGLFEVKENTKQSETQKKTFEEGVKERYEKQFGKPFD